MSLLLLLINNTNKTSHLQEWKLRYKGRIYCALLYGLSATAREQWALLPQLQSVVNHFLRTVNHSDVDPNSAPGRSTDAILSQATSIASLEGAEAQALHRDDSIWQKSHDSQEESGYRLGSDLGMVLLVAGVDVNQANGATLVRCLPACPCSVINILLCSLLNLPVRTRVPSLG
jgi:hypothetical protein